MLIEYERGVELLSVDLMKGGRKSFMQHIFIEYFYVSHFIRG